MDTLVVFCALIFLSAFFRQIHFMMTRKANRLHEQRFSNVVINPFEPIAGGDLHYDPRMARSVQSRRIMKSVKPVRPRLPAQARTKRPSSKVLYLASFKLPALDTVRPQRPTAILAANTSRPEFLMAS